MKKTIATVLTGIALAGLLCACSQDKSSASPSSSPPDSTEKVKPLISLADKPLSARFAPGMGSAIYEIMEAAYGIYRQNMYCYAYKVGGTEYCMEEQYTHTYLGDSRPHLLMTKSAGKVRNGEINRDTSGGLGFFLFTIEGDTVNLIQKQPFLPVWSETETASFQYPQLGKETTFGPNVGSGIEVTLKPQIPDDKSTYERKVYFGIRNNRIIRYGAFRTAYTNATLGTDLKTGIQIADRLAPQSAVFPLEVTVTGKKNGDPILLAPFIFHFDESRNQYIIPPAYIQLMGK